VALAFRERSPRRACLGTPGTCAGSPVNDLDAGDIPDLLAAGRDPKFIGSLAGERDKALHYFETNARRMRHARCKSLGLFIGSGEVTITCQYDKALS
jgi:hypothetical protein